MAELAHSLLRTVLRVFYTTEHILVIDALIIHSTLPESDLAQILSIQQKPLRKLCGRLKEDGLLTSILRPERRLDGSGTYTSSSGQAGRERLVNKEWYYINFHRAIDSIKFRMYKLNKHIEGQGMPTTEKKEVFCPRCGSQYTRLEVMDQIDMATGLFPCPRCGMTLEDVAEEDRANENEGMKRLNIQFDKIMKLLQQIDNTNVPENDFPAALSAQKSIARSDVNPGARTEIVDLPNSNVQSSKGLDLRPEKVEVQIQDDEDVKRESAAAEAAAKKAREAQQNQLPDWISKSTISGDITTVGAKEERQRMERDANTSYTKDEANEDVKPNAGDSDIMENYWAELAKAREQEAAQQRKEEEEDDESGDEFEDVDISGSGQAATKGSSSGAGMSTGVDTPNVESSNATDDERDTKRARMGEAAASSLRNGQADVASDEDEDDLQFEDV